MAGAVPMNSPGPRGSWSKPFRPQTGDPQVRVLSETEELNRSALPPIEVKVNPDKASSRLDISAYERGTGRG